MDNLNSLKAWRVAGVFAEADERRSLLADLAAHLRERAGLDKTVYLCARRNLKRSPYPDAYALEDMSTRRSMLFLRVAAAITPRTLLILDDIETIRNYPQSMTRNIINHIEHRTRYKITGGGALVTEHLYDLYAEFAVLDKRIVHANHYWCFAEDHSEVSVFDGHTVVSNKAVDYLALKLRPFIYLNLAPTNEVQASLYAAIQRALSVKRVQDLSDLRL